MTRAFISAMVLAVWALPAVAQQTSAPAQTDYTRANAEYLAVKRDCADMRDELMGYVGPVNDPLAPRDAACAGLRVDGVPPAQNWGWRSCSDDFFAQYEARRALYLQCAQEEERLGRERLALYREEQRARAEAAAAGPPEPGWLGVEIRRLTSSLARRAGLNSTAGVYVSDTVPGSPARQGGLREGDVIVGFDGRPVTSTADVEAVARTLVAGQTLSVDIVRNSRPQTLSMAIQPRP